MTDPARGPTTEELRARVLAHGSGVWPTSVGECGEHQPLEAPAKGAPRLLLPRPCLACNREQGERMCDLCLRLELAEASAE